MYVASIGRIRDNFSVISFFLLYLYFIQPSSSSTSLKFSVHFCMCMFTKVRFLKFSIGSPVYVCYEEPVWSSRVRKRWGTEEPGSWGMFLKWGRLAWNKSGFMGKITQFNVEIDLILSQILVPRKDWMFLELFGGQLWCGCCIQVEEFGSFWNTYK